MDLRYHIDKTLGQTVKVLSNYLQKKCIKDKERYQEKRNRKGMMKHPPFDFIRDYVFANGYIQIAVHQRHELSNHLWNWKKRKRVSEMTTSCANVAHRKRTHQCLIAFFNSVQECEKCFASLDIKKAHKGIYGIQWSH
jgi:hypothetical protein